MTQQIISPERVSFTTEYTGSAAYNGTGLTERYEIDVPLSVITDFHKLWYYNANQTLAPNTWLGVPLIKYPTDLFIYQQILFELKPDLIIECGTFNGGSALYMATILDAIGKGRIITIDVEALPNRPTHPRIEYLIGSSTDPAIVAAVTWPSTTRFVILDSDHRMAHVEAELAAYAPLADYIIVEDTNCNGHPVRPDFGPGPFEAVRKFLASDEGKGWEMDRARERFMLTCAPGGFLRRRAT